MGAGGVAVLTAHDIVDVGSVLHPTTLASCATPARSDSRHCAPNHRTYRRSSGRQSSSTMRSLCSTSARCRALFGGTHAILRFMARMEYHRRTSLAPAHTPRSRRRGSAASTRVHLLVRPHAVCVSLVTWTVRPSGLSPCDQAIGPVAECLGLFAPWLDLVVSGYGLCSS